jgi:hypothetical protein
MLRLVVGRRPCRHARPALFFTECTMRVGLVAGLRQRQHLALSSAALASASFTMLLDLVLASSPELALMVILFSLPVRLVLGRDVQDAVGVDVEGRPRSAACRAAPAGCPRG